MQPCLLSCGFFQSFQPPLVNVVMRLISEYITEVSFTMYQDWVAWEKEEQLSRELIQKKYDLPWHRLQLEDETIQKVKVDPFLLIQFENKKKSKHSRKRKDRFRPCSWIIDTKKAGIYRDVVHGTSSLHVAERTLSYNPTVESSFRNIGIVGFNEQLEPVGDGAPADGHQRKFRNTPFEVTFTAEEMNDMKLSLNFLNAYANVTDKRRQKKISRHAIPFQTVNNEK